MSAWESTRTPSLRKSASCSIIALRNNSESPILSSSATVHSPSVDWSLLKEPDGGRLRQRPLPFTHSRGHYPPQGLLAGFALSDLLAVVDPAPSVRPGLAYRDHVQGALLSLRL